MAGIAVLFDFDSTIIDLDSDNWVLDELGLTPMFNELLPTMPWNPLMDKMMTEAHSRGKTVGDIVEILRRTPMHPRIVPAIKSAHALGCELRIVSDANKYFIETILDQLGVRSCFSEINANPGFVDGDGKVRFFPFHDYTKAGHGCGLCPPNMCKGLVMDRIQEELGNKRIIYVGDGAGDYCPTLRLKAADFLMQRKDFPLSKIVGKRPELVMAEVHDWADGEEQERVLLQIIDTVGLENSLFSDLPQFSKSSWPAPSG